MPSVLKRQSLFETEIDLD
ncbi:unnamed protein product, partial [Rotaria sordida]